MTDRDLGAVGQRVRAVKFATHNFDGRPAAVDDNVTVPPGTLGTIMGLQSDGSRYVDWDNGSRINLLIDQDEWEVLA
jgi:hypothetical protein